MVVHLPWYPGVGRDPDSTWDKLKIPSVIEFHISQEENHLPWHVLLCRCATSIPNFIKGEDEESFEVPRRNETALCSGMELYCTQSGISAYTALWGGHAFLLLFADRSNDTSLWGWHCISDSIEKFPQLLCPWFNKDYKQLIFHWHFC